MMCTLSYNRVKNQGKKVDFPDARKSNRMAYGRNGKGRHAMFCFSDRKNVMVFDVSSELQYLVELFKIFFLRFI